ncbi:unnamed protein product, partial [Sphenostylis stenocarpa]
SRHKGLCFDQDRQLEVCGWRYQSRNVIPRVAPIPIGEDNPPMQIFASLPFMQTLVNLLSKVKNLGE